jgi:toxin ParE1/3/4
VVIRPRAAIDIEQHAQYLEENALPEIAARFRTAVMGTIDKIAFLPNAGPLREVKNPLLLGLRTAIVAGFKNHLLFYLTTQGSVEIIRLLHGAQEIVSILDGDD